MSRSISAALMNRAVAGNADAQFELAQRYMESEQEDDNALAEEWALKAAHNGQIEAMYWLGEGYAVYAKELESEDPVESKTYFEYAFEWLSQASELDHAAASLELASFYRKGNIIEKDVEKSIHLVKKAAQLGDIQAMRDLAFIYEMGLGTEINLDQAEFWQEKSQQIEPEPKA